MERLMLLNLLFLLTLRSCHGQCLDGNSSIRTNLGTLFDLLTKNAPLANGFYETSVGNKSDTVYGVGQCKPNISSNDCVNCLNTYADRGCRESTSVATISTFCSIKYSSENFFGVLDNSSLASYGDNGLDNPLVFSKGYLMMQGLASTVPNQPLMFQATEVDLGEDEKRYGLAQCSRDLSKLNCQNCLQDRLVNYRSYLQNRTGWEILGISCSMWYSNVSDAYSLSVTALTPSQSQLPPGTPTVTSDAYAPGGTALSPSQSQLPPGTSTVTSGVQRSHEGRGIRGSIIIGSFTFMGLLAIHVFRM